MLRLLIICLALSPAPAAVTDPSLGWLPLPPRLEWHADHAPPAGSALVGRALAIILLDYERGAKNAPGMIQYYGQEWLWGEGGLSNDFKQVGLVVAVNGPLPAKKPEQPATLLKAEDGTGGLLRALGGDAKELLILVNPQGRIVRFERFPGRFDSYVKEFKEMLPTKEALVADYSQFPPSCQPAFILLRAADVRGGMALCSKKLGVAGAGLLKAMVSEASDMAIAEAAILGDVDKPSSDRFIAQGRLLALLADFSQSAKQPAVAAALKMSRSDKAILREQAGWAALQSYISAASKATAKKMAEPQNMLKTIASDFKGTYAAELADFIIKATKTP